MADRKSRLAELAELDGRIEEGELLPQYAMMAMTACADLLLQFGDPAIRSLMGFLEHCRQSGHPEDLVALRVLEQSHRGFKVVADQIDELQLLMAIVSRIMLVPEDVEAELGSNAASAATNEAQAAAVAEEFVMTKAPEAAGPDTVLPGAAVGDPTDDVWDRLDPYPPGTHPEEMP